jgi:hypothetical protein
MRSRLAATAALASLLVVPLTMVPAEAAAPVRFTRVQYNSPGDDTGSNASLNQEWVQITNTGQKARKLTGWRLRDQQGHVFVFPRFTLKPGKRVRVHTGTGARDGNDVFWGLDWYVWNNTGDRATLRNRGGAVIDTCSWGDGSGTTSCG